MLTLLQRRLSQILSGILRDIYSIRARSHSDRLTLTEKYTKELKSWRSSISHFLDTDRSQAAPLVPIFQRQSNSLNLAYWHTVILTHRPLLLSNFARLHRGNRSGGDSGTDEAIREKTNQSIGICLRAAMCIVELVNDIIEARQLYRAYWVSLTSTRVSLAVILTQAAQFTPYYAFSASVILYIYAIQQCAEPEETYISYFLAAEKCQKQIADIAEDGSLTSRYCLVLEELRIEAKTQAHRRQTNQNGIGHGTSSQTEFLPSEQNPNSFGELGNMDLNVSPSDTLADITSWEQFDSMVSNFYKRTFVYCIVGSRADAFMIGNVRFQS